MGLVEHHEICETCQSKISYAKKLSIALVEIFEGKKFYVLTFDGPGLLPRDRLKSLDGLFTLLHGPFLPLFLLLESLKVFGRHLARMFLGDGPFENIGQLWP